MSKMEREDDRKAQQRCKGLIQRAATKSILSGKNINVWQCVDAYPEEDRRRLLAEARREKTRLLELVKGDQFLWPERYPKRQRRLASAPYAAAPVRPRQPNHRRTDTRRAVTRTLHLVDDSEDEEEEVASGGSSAITFQWTRRDSSKADILRVTMPTSLSLRRDLHASAAAMPQLTDSVKAAVTQMDKSSETQTQLMREVYNDVNATKDVVRTELAAVRHEIATLREETRANQATYPPVEPQRSMWSKLRWW